MSFFDKLISNTRSMADEAKAGRAMSPPLGQASREAATQDAGVKEPVATESAPAAVPATPVASAIPTPASAPVVEPTLQQTADAAAVATMPADKAAFIQQASQPVSEIEDWDLAAVAPQTGGQTGRVSLYNTLLPANKSMLDSLKPQRTFTRGEMRQQFKTMNEPDKSMLEKLKAPAQAEATRLAEVSARVSDPEQYQRVEDVDAGTDYLVRMYSAAGAAQAVKRWKDASVAYGLYTDTVNRLQGNYQLMISTLQADTAFAQAAGNYAKAYLTLTENPKQETEVYKNLVVSFEKGGLDNDKLKQAYGSTFSLFQNGSITADQYKQLTSQLYQKNELPADVTNALTASGIPEGSAQWQAAAMMLMTPYYQDKLVQYDAAKRKTVTAQGAAFAPEQVSSIQRAAVSAQTLNAQAAQRDARAIKARREQLRPRARVADVLSRDSALSEAVQMYFYSPDAKTAQAYMDKARQTAKDRNDAEATLLLSVLDTRNGTTQLASLDDALQAATTDDRSEALSRYADGFARGRLMAQETQLNELNLAISGFDQKRKTELDRALKSMNESGETVKIEQMLNIAGAKNLISAIQSAAMTKGATVKWDDIKDSVRETLLRDQWRLPVNPKTDFGYFQALGVPMVQYGVDKKTGEKLWCTAPISPAAYLTNVLIDKAIQSGSDDIIDRAFSDPAYLSAARILAPSLSVNRVKELYANQVQKMEAMKQQAAQSGPTGGPAGGLMKRGGK